MFFIFTHKPLIQLFLVLILGLLVGFFLSIYYINYQLADALNQSFGYTVPYDWTPPAYDDFPILGGSALENVFRSGYSSGGGPGGGDPVPKLNCNDRESLAEKYKVPSVARDSKALKDLMKCIESKVNTEGMGKATFGNRYPECNFTRGLKVCPEKKCTHMEYSCHFGGLIGTDGAEAVDYIGGTLAQKQAVLKAALECNAGLDTRCELTGGEYRPSCENKIIKKKRRVKVLERTHVHVNTSSCVTPSMLTRLKSTLTPEEEEEIYEEEYYME